MQGLKTVFFTNGDFGTGLFESVAGYISDLALVTLPPRKRGRGQELSANGAARFAEAKRIPVLTETDIKSGSFLERIRSMAPDLVITVDYGKIIPSAVLDVPKLVAVNVHPSILPSHRGASPVRAVLLNCESRTGVTIQRMSDKVDAGDIIMQEEIPVSEDDDYGSLSGKLQVLAARMLEVFFRALPEFKAVPQDHSRATYCGKTVPSLLTTDFSESAEAIHGRIRAFSPKPGLTVSFKGRLLKILKSAVIGALDCKDNLPGRVMMSGNDGLLVCTGTKALSLQILQPENGRPMAVRDFINGYRPAAGDIFGPRTAAKQERQDA